eukprot:CAMPEP_0179027066 /NCGR_PEP_ID=MMETSP0796-20121207/8847_1 /TAXON_ID=73915 /ORGANISM="Pyrodinium bahamense, Strain pbaha01" /LENGTH=84 /DNA_ID=CAMNT_0020723183 /DNA_START=18 /DNA_END=269 /DNA_ORIENTATION=+
MPTAVCGCLPSPVLIVASVVLEFVQPAKPLESCVQWALLSDTGAPRRGCRCDGPMSQESGSAGRMPIALTKLCMSSKGSNPVLA